MIEAVIFDLDNCLAAADEPGRDLLRPMFEAIISKNHGRLSDTTLRRAFDDCWRMPLDAVARKYGFPDDMLAAGWEAGRAIEVAVPMRGYPDLGLLPDLPVRRFVVTSGFRRLQESKIDMLRLRSMVEGVYIDAIDEPGRKGKQGIFKEIIERHRLQPGRVLVVGDSPESEIEAGNRLGVRTAQVLRPGVTRGDNATFYLRDLEELRSLLES